MALAHLGMPAAVGGIARVPYRAVPFEKLAATLRTSMSRDTFHRGLRHLKRWGLVVRRDGGWGLTPDDDLEIWLAPSDVLVEFVQRLREQLERLPVRRSLENYTPRPVQVGIPLGVAGRDWALDLVVPLAEGDVPTRELLRRVADKPHRGFAGMRLRQLEREDFVRRRIETVRGGGRGRPRKVEYVGLAPYGERHKALLELNGLED